MKINSFEEVPSIHYAPATKKQPNNRKAKQQQQKKTNKEQTKKQNTKRA